MKMIYTITPNPALDLGGFVDALLPNEKAYVHTETRNPGGNAINAARLISRLGVPVIASGFLGGGIGLEIEGYLESEAIQNQFVKIGGSSRVNVTVSSESSHKQTRLSFPGPLIRPLEVRALRTKISRAKANLVLLGGSFPPGFTVANAKRILRELGLRSIPVFLDVPGCLLKELVSARPFLIKPNLIEFKELVADSKLQSVEQVLKAARKLSAQVPVICISSVEGGALLVTRERAWWGKTPRLRPRSTVGAGDSLMGAMAAGLWQARQRSEASSETIFTERGGELLRQGLAASAATLMHKGTELGSRREIESYLTKVRIEEL